MAPTESAFSGDRDREGEVNLDILYPTLESRLKRITQEIFNKFARSQTIIKAMLLTAGYEEDDITDPIVASYNPLNLNHLDILLKKCVAKGGVWNKRQLEEFYAELINIRTAILQLTKSSLILSRDLWIKKHWWKIILILGGIMIGYICLEKLQEENPPAERSEPKQLLTER